MDFFTWPIAFGIIGFAIPLFTFLNSYLKRPTDLWKHPIEALQQELVLLKNQVKHIEEKMDMLDKDQRDLDVKLFERIDNLDAKIDKFVEILINYFTKK